MSYFSDSLYFILAFILGLLYFYLMSGLKSVVFTNPTRYNADKITYIDDNNVHYKYRVIDVKK